MADSTRLWSEVLKIRFYLLSEDVRLTQPADEEEEFNDLLTDLGVAGLIDDDTALRSMWINLKRDNDPVLVANFQELLTKLSTDLQKKTMYSQESSTSSPPPGLMESMMSAQTEGSSSAEIAPGGTSEMSSTKQAGCTLALSLLRMENIEMSYLAPKNPKANFLCTSTKENKDKRNPQPLARRETKSPSCAQ